MSLAPRLVFLLLLLFQLSLGESRHEWTPKEPDNMFCYTTTGGSASKGGEIVAGRCGESCSARGERTRQWIGWLGVLSAVLFLGSNYVVVKQFEAGDGMFFQWVLCIGIWLVGLVVNMIQNQPPFFLSSLIAGLLWSVGNVLVVPIIKMVGLALGMTIWSTSTLIAGWVSGVFIFDQELRCAPLNYVGIIVIIISTCMLLLVRSDVKKVKINSQPFAKSAKSVLDDSIDTLLRNTPRETQDWADKLGAWPRRILGCSAAVFAGSIFGGQFIPIEYLKLCNDSEHSCEDINYLFGYYTGILTGSTVFLTIYTVFKTNRPWTNPRLILPAILAGVMWGLGSVGVFMANKYLSLAISIPFITTGAQFVSSGWGIIIFKEITGWRQRLLFIAALAVGVCGLVMEGISRCQVECHVQLHNHPS